MNESEIKYLELLSKSFPSIPATAAEIVRLQAILELPKTTEHFMSDIHGEYTYFSHILKNASRARSMTRQRQLRRSSRRGGEKFARPAALLP